MQIIQADYPGMPENLLLQEVPKPVPNAGEVLIKVAYTTLTPIDVFIRQGRVKWLNGTWPFVPGLEFSGRVEALGPGVESHWQGKAVLSFSEFGGCAEYACVPAKRLVPLDESLGWDVATAWRTPTLAAWYALTSALNLRQDETLLVHSAAGPVGIMAAQIAGELGAKVIGLAGGAAKIAYARQFSPAIFFDYSQPDWMQQVRAAVPGGVTAVIDGNGGAQATRNYEVMAPQGRILYLGATSGTVAPDVPVGLLVGKSLSVGGFNLNSIADARIEADLPGLVRKLANGKWRFPLSETVALAEVPSLHARFEARGLQGRVLIRVAGNL